MVAKPSEDLIERISRGDREALTDLYEGNRRALLSYLRTLTGDEQLSEEILQDTLVAAWHGASSFRGGSSDRTWLFAIARRRARDTMRRHRIPSIDLTPLESIASRDPRPDDVVIADEGAERIALAFERLAASHREVLTLIFVHGFSYRDLADLLGVPLGTVKSRLFAAKSALRSCLDAMEGSQ